MIELHKLQNPIKSINGKEMFELYSLTSENLTSMFKKLTAIENFRIN